FMDKEHIQKVINHFNYHNEEELFAAVGYGEISAATVANRLTEDLRKKAEDEKQRQLEEKIMNAGQQSSTEEDDNSDAPADI
ncbi:RelA/SpoT AH/RIS domain-containing protein, partial [Enterococcus faecalis]